MIWALSKDSVETWTSPKVSARILAYVYLPEPGHPTMITLGGLFGALFLWVKIMHHPDTVSPDTVNLYQR